MKKNWKNAKAAANLAKSHKLPKPQYLEGIEGDCLGGHREVELTRLFKIRQIHHFLANPDAHFFLVQEEDISGYI